MFLCLTGRLSAARNGKTTAAFLAQVSANKPRDATLTLHNNNNNTLQGRRCFCVSGGGVDSTRWWRRTLRYRDAFVTTDRTHLDWVAAIAPSLPEPAQSAPYSDFIRKPSVRVNGRHSSTEESLRNVLFTGNWRFPSPRCASGTMQTRASSTKRGDTGQEQTAANKEENQNSVEASAGLPTSVKTSEEAEGAKLNKTQQLKKVFKEYGAVGVCFHICISLMSLGMFYLLISSGIDMAAMLCKLGFSEAVVRSKMAAGTSTFVLAYAIHKLFAPVRISITLVSVPLIVRYFRKTGLFKPPTAAP
ncbi:protein FAM210B, mitochondrial isoform X1 [Takifugu flavidus]|uniref:Protein FAM210B, mitochondrial n=1 Tax=Takifugu flavidus TaxID=433684 RepID=A0A5C6N826_9TELE|nr:protein FAM210B, mitochondrial isoform X1 [Takifugu flavidus]TWW61867.1 Protein FAM210B, mitochondrial [Takifugu flavidus]